MKIDDRVAEQSSSIEIDLCGRVEFCSKVIWNAHKYCQMFDIKSCLLLLS